MKLSSHISLSLCLTYSAAHITTGRPGRGLIGYGIEMYNPPMCIHLQINMTVLADEEVYKSNVNTNIVFEEIETTAESYG